MAVIVFAAISVINLIILIIEIISELARKGIKLPSGKVIFAGQLAKLIMALLFFSGITSGISRLFAGLCAVVCLVSAAAAVKAIVIERELKIFSRVIYIVFALCSIFSSAFILYFQI